MPGSRGGTDVPVDSGRWALTAGAPLGDAGLMTARTDTKGGSAVSVAAAVATRGFAVIPDVLDRSEVAHLVEVLDRLVNQDLEHPDPRRRGDDWMSFNGVLRDDAIAGVVTQPDILRPVESILGPTCIMYACVSSSMPPRGANYSVRVHVDSQRVIPSYPTNVGALVALTDFTEANGATRFLPGSFERLDRPTQEEFDRDAEMVFPGAGSVVIFNARTWHSGGVNRTDEPRHALTVNYCRAYMRQHFDFVRMVPPERVPTLSPVLRRVLGFDVRMPTSLDEYYVDEADRLYKPNQG
jgi:ectoine hydroxylase-related dioxygenase (phytanoyl-CoA dioxygenase family)